MRRLQPTASPVLGNTLPLSWVLWFCFCFALISWGLDEGREGVFFPCTRKKTFPADFHSHLIGQNGVPNLMPMTVPKTGNGKWKFHGWFRWMEVLSLGLENVQHLLKHIFCWQRRTGWRAVSARGNHDELLSYLKALSASLHPTSPTSKSYELFEDNLKCHFFHDIFPYAFKSASITSSSNCPKPL